MGANNSKTFLTVSCLVLATTTSAEAASQGSSWGLLGKGFASKSQNVAFIDHAASNVGVFKVRGGESTTADVESKGAEAEMSLDDKVQAAMKKLGISPPDGENEGIANGDNASCKDGVCELPKAEATNDEESASSNASTSDSNMDPHEMAEVIAKDMGVGTDLAMAAIGATATIDNNEHVYNEQAARDMIQHELDLISSIPEDSDNVKKLMEEGYDSFLCRRALAFVDGNMDDARAILLADKLDAEEEERLAKEEQEKEDEEAAMRAELRKEHEASQTKQPDMVEVKADFDPTTLPTTTAAAPKPQTQSSAGNTAKPDGMPGPARKADVVFDASSTQIQELVLESPVPVLLDVYADWCGPCKALTPALEEMAVKAGGIFRLVKVNSDNNKPVSAALEVTALPTVFGIRDGKIVHMFQGMPRSEEMMKNFMMGLFGAAPFSPPVTADEKLKYEELTNKLIKTAGSACFSFSARERLTDRITTKLGELKDDESVPDVEGTATLIRTLLSNIVKNPYEQKYRKINLDNKKIAQMIGSNASCLAVLKSVGFAKNNGSNGLNLGKGKKVINVAPMVVARDCIDNWILRNRKEMAALARKRKDEADRAKLQAEREAAGWDEEEVEEEVEEVDETACQLKLRLDGKKKVHDVTLHVDDPLSKVLDALDIDTTATEEEIQITCVAKRLVVKSSDSDAMKKTLVEHGLKPKAAIVVKVGGNNNNSSSSLKERMAEKKNLKKGSHTMQSIGIYAKDDNNKAELIDGGGGVWYEHDVSDDEGEAEEEVKSDEENGENETAENANKGNAEDEPNDEGVDAEESQ